MRSRSRLSWTCMGLGALLVVVALAAVSQWAAVAAVSLWTVLALGSMLVGAGFLLGGTVLALAK